MPWHHIGSSKIALRRKSGTSSTFSAGRTTSISSAWGRACHLCAATVSQILSAAGGSRKKTPKPLPSKRIQVHSSLSTPQTNDRYTLAKNVTCQDQGTRANGKRREDGTLQAPGQWPREKSQCAHDKSRDNKATRPPSPHHKDNSHRQGQTDKPRSATTAGATASAPPALPCYAASVNRCIDRSPEDDDGKTDGKTPTLPLPGDLCKLDHNANVHLGTYAVELPTAADTLPFLAV